MKLDRFQVDLFYLFAKLIEFSKGDQIIMLLEAWNVVYTVVFPEDEHLNDEFSSREEALAYANEHLDKNPVVKGKEIYIDEHGAGVEEGEEEIIMDHKEEPEVVEPRVDELDARLKALMEPEVEIPSEVKDEEPAKEIEKCEPDPVTGEEVCSKVEETEVPAEEPFVVEPGIFDQDFDIEVEPDNPDFSPADFLSELAAELGIEDQVEIIPVNDEIPLVDEPEVVKDDSAFAEIPEIERPDIDYTFDSDFFSDYLPEEEPEVELEVAPEAEVAIAIAEDPVASEAPVEDEPIEDKEEDKIEEAKQEEPVLVQKAIPCDVELKGADCADDVCEKQPLVAHDEDTVKDLKKLDEEVVEENKVLTNFVQDKMSKGEGINDIVNSEEFKDLATEEGKKDLGLKEATSAEAALNEFEAHLDEDKKQPIDPEIEVNTTMDLLDAEADKQEEIQAEIEKAVDELDEAAKPELDNVKAFNDALKLAKENSKPVIYGYMGTDHHGVHRYFGIDFIVCDDLEKCTSEVMKKYHPSGSVLVAYPDKDFVEESLEEEMTDEEFLEEFGKALIAKREEK